MKKLRISVALVLLIIYINPLITNGQSIKELLNDLNQSGQNAVASKVIGKLDSVLQKKSKPVDTSSVHKVLGAFSKAAAANPRDTSPADVTMKALGILTEGDGVSAADSSEAIRSFMSSHGGSGVLIEYVTTITSKDRGTIYDTARSCFTSAGEGRHEMNLAGMMGVKGGKTLVTLGRVNESGYSIILDAESKTYSLNIIDTSLINSSGESCQVTKLGEETVQGYPCIHSQLKESTGTSIFKSTSTMDIWTSENVPGYTLMKKMMAIQNVKPQMLRALEKAGCGGFIVKIVSQAKDYSMNMELVKAQEKDLSASLFKIPEGYSESKNNLLIGNLAGVPQKQ